MNRWLGIAEKDAVRASPQREGQPLHRFGAGVRERNAPPRVRGLHLLPCLHLGKKFGRADDLIPQPGSQLTDGPGPRRGRELWMETTPLDQLFRQKAHVPPPALAKKA